MNELLGVKDVLDADDFLKLVVRLAINLLFAGAVVFRYARRYGQDHFTFTYLLFNVITFCLCFLLRKVPIELGFALGLFAVFGILRYRTEPIGIRNLTYMFVVIGIAILNAVSNKKVSLGELLLVNVAIVGTTLLLEWAPFRSRNATQEVVYDDLELLRKGDRAALFKDISERTGLAVRGIRVDRFDLLRDVAVLQVTYRRRES